MAGGNLSWGVSSPRPQGCKLRCEFPLSWDIFMRSKAKQRFLHLNVFIFEFLKAVTDFLIRGFFFLLQQLHMTIFSFEWKLVWGSLKRNYLRDAGTQDLEISKYFIQKKKPKNKNPQKPPKTQLSCSAVKTRKSLSYASYFSLITNQNHNHQQQKSFSWSYLILRTLCKRKVKKRKISGFSTDHEFLRTGAPVSIRAS